MTATTAASFPDVQRNLKGFLRGLKYVVCEWILIFLLFVDAAFSYMLTGFAQLCDLQSPCMLCTRLDHVFGSVKDGFYRNLFCRNHRNEISFLLACDIHDKLVDGRGMCDECLMSCVEGHESDSDMQRLVVGKLGYDGKCGSKSSVFDGVIRFCVCCNKTWANRPESHRLPLLKSLGMGMAASESNVHLPRSISSPNDLNMMRYMCCAPAASHLRDTDEVKITSKSKSWFPSSDNHDGNSVVRDLNEYEPKKQTDANESRDVRCLAPESEQKEKLADKKDNFNELPELVSLDDYSTSFGLTDVPSFSPSLLADIISMVDTSNPDNANDVSMESFSDNSNKTGPRFETGPVVDYTSRLSLPAGDRSAPEFVTKYMLAYTNGANGDLKSLPASESAGDQSAPEVVTKSISTETQTGPDIDRVAVQTLPVIGEDLKSLPAHNSFDLGNQLSLNYLSPELQDRAVELLRSDSNSVEVRNLKNLFIEAISESPDLKPFDESNVIEGESEFDTLKRQVDDAREYINALSKELEEERNASAIAANQAMAMITRLQEEKAALRTEALQYLRMMEEQAEYDVEALDKANDLLTEKERELQDLEAELEYYRLNFPDETPEETEPVINLDKEHALTMNTTTTCSKTESPDETGFPEACLVDDQPVIITAWSEIEEEKLYISNLLQKLEKKLNRLAQYGASQHNSDIEHSDDNEKGRKREQKASSAANGTRPDGDTAFPGDDECEDSRENGFEDVESELLELYERFESLEADCSFLHRSLNSLKTGKEGLVLIQEILHLLREVKKIGLKTMDTSEL